MQEISPEQKAHLETWAGQRDLILSEISNLQTLKETLTKEVQNLSISCTEIETRANKIEGRIVELEKKEIELSGLTSRDLVGLQDQKSVLEVEVMHFTKMVELLSSQKTSLEQDVSSAIANFNLLKDEALVLDKIVDHVTVVSEGNTRKMNDLIDSLAKSLEEIIAVNKKNVFETNVVIEKLPAMLMEAQKHGLIKPRNNVLRVK